METLLALIAKIQESPMASGIVLAALVGWAVFVLHMTATAASVSLPASGGLLQ